MITKIKTRNYFIALALLTMVFACKSNSPDENKSLLQTAILSEDFSKNFNLCEKEVNDINVFNDSGTFENYTFNKKNHCSKQINFSEKVKAGIVLYDVNQEIEWVKFSFLNVETNETFFMKYGNNSNLIKTETGIL